MLFIVIWLAFISTQVLSYFGKPLLYGTADTTKIKLEYERQWHEFLVLHGSFRCLAGRANLILPVDYEIPRGCNPKGRIYDGKPSNIPIVPSETWDDHQKWWFYDELPKNPIYRCQAAAANLTLPVDYEVPPNCILDMKFSFTIVNNRTTTTQHYTENIYRGSTFKLNTLTDFTTSSVIDDSDEVTNSTPETNTPRDFTITTSSVIDDLDIVTNRTPEVNTPTDFTITASSVIDESDIVTNHSPEANTPTDFTITSSSVIDDSDKMTNQTPEANTPTDFTITPSSVIDDSDKVTNQTPETNTPSDFTITASSVIDESDIVTNRTPEANTPTDFTITTSSLIDDSDDVTNSTPETNTSTDFTITNSSIIDESDGKTNPGGNSIFKEYIIITIVVLVAILLLGILIYICVRRRNFRKYILVDSGQCCRLLRLCFQKEVLATPETVLELV